MLSLCLPVLRAGVRDGGGSRLATGRVDPLQHLHVLVGVHLVLSLPAPSQRVQDCDNVPLGHVLVNSVGEAPGVCAVKLKSGALQPQPRGVHGQDLRKYTALLFVNVFSSIKTVYLH